MTLSTDTTNTIYDTLVAEDATWIDGAAVSTAVRVIPEHDPTTLLSAADLGIRGAQRGYYVRKASFADRPRKGDQIVHGGSTYVVAGPPFDFSATEWLVYVVT
jgi:hypothetical protein